MRNITIHNYELFFMDYIDGKLSNQESEMLNKFLMQHPDLKAELEAFEEVELEADQSIKFRAKKQLKKTDVDSILINGLNFDELCIAYTENDLTNETEYLLLKSIETLPELKKQLNDYQQLKLKADNRIKFELKVKMKKNIVFQLSDKRKIVYLISSLAASILLIISIFNFRYNTIDKQVVTINNLKHEINQGKKSKTLSINNNSISESSNIINYSNSPSINIKSIKKHKNPEKDQQKNKDEEVVPQLTEYKSNNQKKLKYIELKGRPFERLKVKNSTGHLIGMSEIQSCNYNSSNTDNEYLTINQLINKKIIGSPTPENNRKPKFWDYAKASVKKISVLTGKNIEIENAYDENGKLIALAVKTENFEFSRKKGSKNNE